MEMFYRFARFAGAGAALFVASANCLLAAEDAQNPQFEPAALEFFEKEVRPLLVARCFECHGTDAKRIEGGLVMSSRAALLKGGDTGPAIVSGNPKKSLLVDAINYGELYEMPPKGKLPEKEIAVLTRWVEMGAPWPAQSSDPSREAKNFDLAQRRANHWAWQPIANPKPPAVKDEAWPLDPLDRFILARVEGAGLKPNPPADAAALLRRLSFDLIGLPPTPEEIADFELRIAELQKKENRPHPDPLPRGEGGKVESPHPDQSAIRIPQSAIRHEVDRLLDSPHFGERWGRHWLDLVRYAESRGHEFDYDLPNAWQYRDYVIRAFNENVPYDQFVVEHVAGDLLDQPRLHKEEGFNESILGTGFWFLGEWVHSPVDIRKDELDRQDNQLDVFGKTFLGMTVACARCHDHKFDAISQKDYYALAGFLQSSDYRLARFDSLHHNKKIAAQLHDLRTRSAEQLARLTVAARQPVLKQLDQYLLAARETILLGPDEDADDTAKNDGDIVIEDFEKGTYEGWKIDGTAFGAGPQTQETIGDYQGDVNAQGRFFVNSHNIRSKEDVRGGDDHVGTLTSPTFKITRRYLRMRIGGGGHRGKTCVNLLIGDREAGSLAGKNNNRMELRWLNVSQLAGQEARLQIVDNERGGWGNIGVDEIILTNAGPTAQAAAENDSKQYQRRAQQVAGKHGLDGDVLLAWVGHLHDAKNKPHDPLHAWARAALDANIKSPDELAKAVKPWAEKFPPQDAAPREVTANTDLIIDYARLADRDWLQDGVSFGLGPLRPGELLLGDDAQRPIRGVATYGAAVRDGAFKGLSLAAGAANDSGKISRWPRAGQSIRTPTFTIQDGPLHYLVKGAGRALAVVDSHRMLNGPLHGEVMFEWNDDGKGQPRWVTHNLQRQKGHRAHVEFSPHGDGDLEILMVAQGPGTFSLFANSSPAAPVAQALRAADEKAAFETLDTALQAVANKHQSLLSETAEKLASGKLNQHSTNISALADWIVAHPQLFIQAESEPAKALAAAGEAFVKEQAALAAQVRKPSRLAPAMWDGSGENELLLIRGNSVTPAGAVPRRLLTALGGSVSSEAGSGRLQLARQLIDPANPLTSRVMVNRIWHHLTGRGIVPSVDNFGVLGQEPSHGELLDHLATRFMAQGWSVKRIIKTIVMSRTYQMSSHPNPAAAEIDPANKLLHRMRIRRLEGEAVRDSLLAVSGRLDRTLYGPSVPVYLTPFMTGRGRPGGGPLDGKGRRSIYISVRRNFLSPMMLAFDMPQPFSTQGQRTVSNVPAQALIMMNDPLVIQQAQLWARRVLAEKDLTPRQRIEKMYLTAFARSASDEEISQALAFLTEQAKLHGLAEDAVATAEQPWADLCHVLFNVKEFIFVN